ncbi:hypothetical protein ACQJBY_063488 [Aegilops geniculata]
MKLQWSITGGAVGACVGVFAALHSASMELQWSIAGVAVLCCRLVALHASRSAAMKLQWSISGNRHAAHDGRRGTSCNITVAAYYARHCPPTFAAPSLLRGRGREGCNGTMAGAALIGAGASPLLRGRRPWVRRQVLQSLVFSLHHRHLLRPERRRVWVSQQPAGCRKHERVADRTDHMCLIGWFASRMIS